MYANHELLALVSLHCSFTFLIWEITGAVCSYQVSLFFLCWEVSCDWTRQSLFHASCSWVEVIHNFLRFSSQRFAKGLAEAVISLNLPVEVISLGDYDPDDCLAEEVCNKYKLFLVLSRIFSFRISLLLSWKSPKLCVCKLLLKHRWA